MRGTDWLVVALLGGAAYLLVRRLGAQPGVARTYYATGDGHRNASMVPHWTVADQDDRDLGNAWQALEQTVQGVERAPAGASWDPQQGGFTLNGMLYT